MSTARLAVAGLFVLLPVGCGDDGDDGAETGTTGSVITIVSLTAEELCQHAADTLGAADPPADLAGVGSGADAIAALTASEETLDADLDPPLADALAAVGTAATALSGATGGDVATIAERAGALSVAYDELDQVAAELRIGVCSSESWGRRVAIAAVDLTGAGG